MAPYRQVRPIRMNDEEWEAFRVHLGAAWLRAQIAKAMKRNASIPTKTKDQDQ